MLFLSPGTSPWTLVPLRLGIFNEITIIDFFQKPEQSSVVRDSFSVATSFKYREQGKEW